MSVIVDERRSSGTYIEWIYTPEDDTHVIQILDCDEREYRLVPRNGREATSMFEHTYAYDWIPHTTDPCADILVDNGREFSAPRS